MQYHLLCFCSNPVEEKDKSIVMKPCMGGRRVLVYVCMYVRGGLESRQTRNGSGTGKRQREMRVGGVRQRGGDFVESTVGWWPAVSRESEPRGGSWGPV